MRSSSSSSATIAPPSRRRRRRLHDTLPALALGGCGELHCDLRKRPVDYSDRLRALPRPDLEELLARRPETAALLSRPAAGHADLAGLLAQPQNVRRAVASLDRFHRQVLELACVVGGRLDPDLAAQEGLEAALLTGAARELA